MTPDPNAHDDAGSRLSALDPFAGADYVHPDASSMVSRITSRSPARRPRRRRELLAPVAGLLATGLATIGLAIAATPGPALSPLALSSVGTERTEGAPQLRATALHVEGSTYLSGIPSYAFSAEKGYGDAAGAPEPTATQDDVAYGIDGVNEPLAEHVPNEDTLELVDPSRPSAVLDDVASALGFRRSRLERRGGAWRVVAGHAVATLDEDPTSGLDVLDVVAQRTAGCASGGGWLPFVSGVPEMRATLASLASRLGLPYELAEPRVTVAVGRVDGACGAVASIGEQVAIGGVATDQVVTASFGPSGQLLSASLPVFAVRRQVAYPLLSARQAVAPLVAATRGLSLSPVAGAATTTAGMAKTEHRAVASVPTVELHAATFGLQVFRSTSGAIWLVPVYQLSGDLYSSIANPRPWSGAVLATGPAVRLDDGGSLGLIDPRVGR